MCRQMSILRCWALEHKTHVTQQSTLCQEFNKRQWWAFIGRDCTSTVSLLISSDVFCAWARRPSRTANESWTLHSLESNLLLNVCEFGPCTMVAIVTAPTSAVRYEICVAFLPAWPVHGKSSASEYYYQVRSNWRIYLFGTTGIMTSPHCPKAPKALVPCYHLQPWSTSLSWEQQVNPFKSSLNFFYWGTGE